MHPTIPDRVWLWPSAGDGLWTWMEETLKRDGRIGIGALWSKAWNGGCHPFDLGWTVAGWGLDWDFDEAAGAASLAPLPGKTWSRRGARGWNPRPWTGPLPQPAPNVDGPGAQKAEPTLAPPGFSMWWWPGACPQFWNWAAAELEGGKLVRLTDLWARAWATGEHPFGLGWQLSIWGAEPVEAEGRTYLHCPEGVKRWKDGVPPESRGSVPWNIGGDPKENGGTDPVTGVESGRGLS